MNQAAEQIVRFWEDPRNIPFKGEIIIRRRNGEICMCAQGQILFKNDWEIEELETIKQEDADKEVAKLLGISISHSILLRAVNDTESGAPGDVLTNPEKYLGPNYQAVLDFWFLIDTLTEEQWVTINKNYDTFVFSAYTNDFSEGYRSYEQRANVIHKNGWMWGDITTQAVLMDAPDEDIFLKFCHCKAAMRLVTYALMIGESDLYQNIFTGVQQ